jgi:biopolymer transport protein ExbD
LPKTQAVAGNERLQQAHLVVDAHGDFALENAHISDQALAELLHTRALDPQFQLQVEADKAVPYGRVAELMALAQHAGVTKMSFLTIAAK